MQRPETDKAMAKPDTTKGLQSLKKEELIERVQELEASNANIAAQ